MQCISFDIITAADLMSGCRLYGLENLDQHAISNVMLYKQRQQNSDEQLPIHLQCIVAVSLVIAEAGKLSFVQLQSDDEATLLRELFAILEGESCRIYWQQEQVLTLLQLRALQHSVVLPLDWPMPRSEFRRALQCGWFDLNQMLSVSGGQNALAEVASMAALPAQLGIATAQCREIESAEQLANLQQGCLVNAMHIHLLYLRLAFIQGVLCRDAYQQMLKSIEQQLKNSNFPVMQRYLNSMLLGNK